MKIVEFLSEKAVTANLKATTKEAALRELVDILAKAEGIKGKEDLIKVLLGRESLGSTGIGQGVGIPHAKTKPGRFSDPGPERGQECKTSSRANCNNRHGSRLLQKGLLLQ